ncbi:MAG: hypothetical protein HC916_11215 [Coleofasciculaceae cyanobacterium SM2_1_6]|nr:hypothetical protein [Coleofasciculaceae cyanobacterium SM2_1_6]
MSQALNSVIESLNTLSLEEKHQLWQILESTILQAEAEKINNPQPVKSALSLEQSAPVIQEFMQLSQSGRSLDFLYNEPDLYTLADGELK